MSTSHLRGISPRANSFVSSRLMALVLLMLVVAPSAFAAGEFPFLSINQDQLQSLYIAFGVQWGLFKGFTVGGGGGTALYYVALAATLVGALSMVFNKAAQEFKTIISWFVIVIMCLFAPYNSQLLFPDIKQPSTLSGDPVSSKLGSVNGFTPQLLAAHIGTTLQVIMGDLFKSAGIRSMVDGALARAAMNNMPQLDAGPGWLSAVDNYAKQCPSANIAPAELIKRVRASNGFTASASGGASTPAQGFTFKDAFAQIANSYNSDIASDFRSPPQAIVLSESIPAGNTNNTYINGVVALGSALGITINPNDTTSVTQGVQQILRNAKEYNSSGSADPSNLYFYIRGETTQTSDHVARTAIAKSCTTDTSVDAAATDWIGGGAAATVETTVRRAGTCDQILADVKNQLRGTPNPLKAGKFTNAELANVVGKINNDQALGALPVKMWGYKGSNASDGGSLKTYKCDETMGEDLFDQMFKISGISGDKLKSLISGTGPVPKGPWVASDISDVNTPFVQNLVTYLNSTGGGLDALKVGSDDQKRLALASIVKQVVLDNTKNGESNQGIAQADARYGIGAQQGTTGTNVVTRMLGGTGAAIAKGVVNWFSTFASIGAVAILLILKVIIDMALMLIIIVTPIAFLIGIAIPNHAFGLLVQSFVMVLILKMVPVTFIIIDSVGDIIYRALSTAPDAAWSWLPWSDTGFKQGVFLFGIAGLYASMVSLTMFLLFKLGDTGNIQKLTEVDAAAKKVGDIGEKIGQLIGTIAAMAVGGGALAGSAALMRKAGLGGAALEEGMAAAGSKMVGDATDKLYSSIPGGTTIAAAMKDGKIPENADEAQDTDGEFLKDLDNLEKDYNKTKKTDADTEEYLAQRKMAGYRLGARSMLEQSGQAGQFNEVEKAQLLEQLTAAQGDLHSESSEDRDGVQAKMYELVGDALMEKTKVAQQAAASLADTEAMVNAAAGGKFGAISSATVNDLHKARMESGELTERDIRGRLLDMQQKAVGVAVSDVDAQQVLGGHMTAAHAISKQAAVAQQSTSTSTQTQQTQQAQTTATNQTTTAGASNITSTGNIVAGASGVGPAATQASQAAASTGTAAPTPWKGPSQGAGFEEQLLAAIKELDKNLKDPAYRTVNIGNPEVLAAKMAQTEMATKAGSDLLLAKIKASDMPEPKKPSVLYTTFSGAVGGVMASGALSQIPGVGNFVKEIFNEFTEGPERARVWAQRGGMMKWLGAKSDASRLESLKKNQAAYGGQAEYLGLAQAGAFDSAVKQATMAAAQAVAKAQSQNVTIQMKEGQLGSPMTWKDFQHGELAQAMESLENSLAASAMMTKGYVEVGNGAKLKLDASVIQTLVASTSHKGIDGQIQEMLGKHMYQHTKAGTDGYAQKRGGGRERMRQGLADFITEDSGADYQVGTYIKWLQGKQGFKQQMGQARAIQEAIGMQKVRLDKFKFDNPSASAAEVSAFKSTLNIERQHTFSELQGYYNQALSSFQAKMVDDLKDNFERNIKVSQNAPQYVARFERNLESELSEMIGDVERMIGQQIDAAIKQALPNAYRNLSRGSKARLGSNGFRSQNSINELMEGLMKAAEDTGKTDEDLNEKIERALMLRARGMS